MKISYSRLARATFLVSLEHLRDYINYLDELEKLYWYKADCKRLAKSIMGLLESAQEMEVPQLARGAIRTVASLTLVASEYSNDPYTFAIETNMKLIEHELTQVIRRESARAKQKLQKQAAKKAA